MDKVNLREKHRSEVINLLQREFSGPKWHIVLPPNGTGHETYLAQSNDGKEYFIKLGACTDRYLILSALGLSPQVVLVTHLKDGIPVIVQQKVNGRMPTRQDFHAYLDQFAQVLQKTHQNKQLQQSLPTMPSDKFSDIGLAVLGKIDQRWITHKSKVPASAKFIDDTMDYLAEQISHFTGEGLVASHNDVCNGNWLVSPDGKVYLLDYESMSLDDPALDMGAILWWYYPPNMRQRFLEIAGYRYDDAFKHGMMIRMAIHNLNIIIPRERSFDNFDPDSFEDSLEDLRAVINGKENPQGYYD